VSQIAVEQFYAAQREGCQRQHGEDHSGTEQRKDHRARESRGVQGDQAADRERQDTGSEPGEQQKDRHHSHPLVLRSNS
jgi:hypothetical protein